MIRFKLPSSKHNDPLLIRPIQSRNQSHFFRRKGQKLYKSNIGGKSFFGERVRDSAQIVNVTYVNGTSAVFTLPDNDRSLFRIETRRYNHKIDFAYWQVHTLYRPRV